LRHAGSCGGEFITEEFIKDTRGCISSGCRCRHRRAIIRSASRLVGRPTEEVSFQEEVVEEGNVSCRKPEKGKKTGKGGEGGGREGQSGKQEVEWGVSEWSVEVSQRSTRRSSE
jgi:hypothetical protein